MTLKAIHTILHDGTIFGPGQVFCVNEVSADRLIAVGAAEIVSGAEADVLEFDTIEADTKPREKR